MLKRLVIGILAVTFCGISFAETCPSIEAIKTSSLTGWKALEDETDRPLTSQQLTRFKTNAQQFALAEFDNKTNQIGSVRCYYRDSTGSNLEAYLAKDNFQLHAAKSFWYPVTGSMQCAAGMDKCAFTPHLANNPTLARK